MAGIAQAQSAGAAGTPNAAFEQRRQQERLDVLRRQQERAMDVRRPAAPAADPSRLPDRETPCFVIDRLQLTGDQAGRFTWLLNAAKGADGEDKPEGRCLGSQGINLVLKRLQNALITEGYITTRVVAEAQDLKAGTLSLVLQPGRIHAIRFAGEDPAPTSLRTAVPAGPGDILNLRDVEQALENFKRIPSADADLRIEPAEVPGESDLVIVYRRTSPWRTTLGADDGGTRATGKYQGNVTVAYDNPAGLNDLAYVSLGHDLGGQGGGRGTDALVGHYSVPFGYWSAALTVSRNRDHQTVAGAFQNYEYRGSSSTAELKLSRLVYRDGSRKTTLSLTGFRRASHNFIDDTEVEVQRRAVGGWNMAANHREFLGAATLDATVAHKRGTGAFGSIAAPEEIFGEGTSRFKLSSAELNLDLPFELAGRNLLYLGTLRGQWNHTRLTPQDMFVIGGRYTVRGFDGDMVLSAERGWLLRNEVGLRLGSTGMEAYTAIDYGEVAGPTSGLLLGKRLAGAAIGVRGNYKGLSYDVFAGAPLHKPEGFRTAATTAGIRLGFSF
jgi:hemolysin activation/secretion protein